MTKLERFLEEYGIKDEFICAFTNDELRTRHRETPFAIFNETEGNSPRAIMSAFAWREAAKFTPRFWDMIDDEYKRRMFNNKY